MLEGDLSDFTLPEILKLLAFTSKTGRLHLRRDGTLGRIEVGAGRVQAASADAAHLPLARRLVGRGLLDTDTLQALTDGRDELPTDLELAQALVDADVGAADAVASAVRAQSVDAVFDLLRWTEGQFRFAVEDVPSTGPLAVDHDLDELLEQAQERLERWADIHERTGPGDASVSVTSPADTSVEIDADAWQLIGLADGSRTIDELVQLTGRGQFDTRSTLVELADRGLVAFGTEERDGTLERLLRAQTALGALEERLATGAAPDPVTQDERSDTLVAEFDLDALDDLADHGDTSDDADSFDDEHASDAPNVAAPHTDTPNADTPNADTSAPPAPPAPPAPLGRRPRLRTDPTVDPALVDRLIDGVRNLA